MTSRLLASRRFPDPATSTDPAIQSLLASLRALPVAGRPSADFTTDLRAQLVAIAPRVIEESGTGVAASGDATRRRFPALINPALIRRPLAVAVAAACLLVLLAGALVGLSRSALPGDTLYRVKQTAESVQLAFAHGDQSKAQQYLSFAATRAGEAQALAAGPQSARTAARVQQALADGDQDVRLASQLLTGDAARTSAAQPLTVLQQWLPQQQGRLQGVADRLPAGPARDSVMQSLALLQQAQGRTTALRALLGQPCLATAGTDPLGTLPCTAGPGPVGTSSGTIPGSTGGPGGSGGSGGTAGSPGQPGGQSGGTQTGGTQTGGAAGGGTAGGNQPAGSGSLPGATVPSGVPTVPGGSGSTGGSLPLPTLSVPSLPLPTSATPALPLPTLSVPSVSVPGVSASLPGVGSVNVTPCVLGVLGCGK